MNCMPRGPKIFIQIKIEMSLIHLKLPFYDIVSYGFHFRPLKLHLEIFCLQSTVRKIKKDLILCD